MRGLAEFIMRGRWQALAVAVLGAGTLLFGWISAAAVALVTLRKGLSEGSWVVLWAMLPALVMTYVSGDAGTMLMLLGAYALALVLRETVSLALTVSASVVIGLVTGGVLLAFSRAFLAEIVSVFDAVLGQIESNLEFQQAAEVELMRPTVIQVAGMLSAGNAAVTVISVLLARYWQALLYNPGGFGIEFRALKLPASWTLLLVALTIGLWSVGFDYRGWAVIFAVPLMFCGFALVHSYAQLAGRGSFWLTMFYLLWLLVDLAKALLILLVVIDIWVNFRARWDRSGGTGA